MAYRFLLEVPDELYNQANLVITSVPDADIVDVHEGIGGDFDAQGKTITLIAQSLRVIESLSTWYADAPKGDLPVSVALTNGVHMVPGEVSDADIVSAIRRDQPWVDRSIPKIGDHQTRVGPAEAFQSPAASTGRGVAVVNKPATADIVILATDEPTDHPVITVDDFTMLHLPVVDLPLPQKAYAGVFGTEVVRHADRDGKGGWTWLEPQYDDRPISQPDFAFLQNGALTLALERRGRAYPLDVFSNPPAPIRLLVDDASFEKIKAQVMVRNWNVFDDTTPGVFGFRDPFGYTWAIHSESFEKGEIANA